MNKAEIEKEIERKKDNLKEKIGKNIIDDYDYNMDLDIVKLESRLSQCIDDEKEFKELINKIKEEISEVFYNCKDELGMTSLIIDKHISKLDGCKK